MKRKMTALLALAALALTLVLTRPRIVNEAQAQEGDRIAQPVDGGGLVQDDRDREVPFALNGVEWRSKEAFVLSGARCATVMPDEQRIAKEGQRIVDFNTQRGRAPFDPSAQRTAGSVTIKVYFHVIRKGTGAANGDIPTSMIDAQISTLNKAFAGTAPGGAGAPTPFKFVKTLVTRTTSATWYTAGPGTSAELSMKSTLRRGTSRDLNIYSNSPGGGLLGWATFPWEFDTRANGAKLDGVVVLNQSLPGGTAAPYNLGDTAVHEVGHWFGLFHTFQGGCAVTGDRISDTPSEASPAFGCPTGRNTCAATGNDPITNFMDYTDDACMFKFTPKQAYRADVLSEIHRES
jgi:hypothetical protein